MDWTFFEPIELPNGHTQIILAVHDSGTLFENYPAPLGPYVSFSHIRTDYNGQRRLYEIVTRDYVQVVREGLEKILSATDRQLGAALIELRSQLPG